MYYQRFYHVMRYGRGNPLLGSLDLWTFVVEFSYAWVDVQTKYRRQRVGKLILKQTKYHETHTLSFSCESVEMASQIANQIDIDLTSIRCESVVSMSN